MQEKIKIKILTSLLAEQKYGKAQSEHICLKL